MTLKRTHSLEAGSVDKDISFFLLKAKEREADDASLKFYLKFNDDF